jgi:hypothetical protein
MRKGIFHRTGQLPAVPPEQEQAGSHEIEFDFPFLKIPNGRPADDRERYWLSDSNEPSADELGAFFRDTPGAAERLIVCNQINVDLTDDWGMFGYEPGFLFVCGKNYTGASTFNDATFMTELAAGPSITTESGGSIPVLNHYDSFPRTKFDAQFITPGRTPQTYAYITEHLDEILRPAEEIGGMAPQIAAGRLALDGFSVPEQQ